MPRPTDLHFTSQGLRCAGTLMRPPRVKRPPLIIMAHGFAAERGFRLPAFAERFVAIGFAVFLFDYRNFGGSEGEPRHWVDPWRHHEDWRAALAFMQARDDIDRERIVLWGSSFSGGHVLQIASERPRIAAVISQVPHVDGLATLRQMPLKQVIKGTVAGVRDTLGRLVGRPHYVPVVGRPGSFAAMTTPETYDGWFAIVPEDSQWQNRVLGRAFLGVPLYSPIRRAHRIEVPTLIIAGSDDSITPPASARKAAAKIPDAEFHCLSTNHFQPYVGEAFEVNIDLQLDFLQRRVLKTP
ncbi:alpha/beta fold hydrolase [Flagellatimonas centrodinii]|uniref:alpha/beta hydrolase n=1 Tax=Flagellatimonas centrodinii TaxID=2806210 RepID=UPI001FEF581C|nr:alpha/beta fold hydrolase [Flagellatimonas centrodinii]ULQ46894.1 alpha/beta fold hydrolase [Flagellatimonas centrodinii]